MRIEGIPTDQICEELGVEKRTVYIWFSDPLVKAELSVQVQLVNEIFGEKLAAAGVAALDQLKALAQAPVDGPVSPQLKLEIVREVLDRVSSHPTLSKGLPNIFSDMSPSEIVERLQEIVGPSDHDLEPPNVEGTEGARPGNGRFA